MISLLGKKTEAEKGVSAKQKNTPKRLQLPRTSLLPTACVGGTRESRTRSGVLGGDSSISVRAERGIPCRRQGTDKDKSSAGQRSRDDAAK